jgi:hypothetical protein
MDPDHLLHRCGKEAKGVILPQILFGGERQVHQIVQTPDILRLNPGLFHLPPVIGNPCVNPGHNLS